MDAKKRLDRKEQVGGALAAFVGVLLLLSAGPESAGPVDRHKMAIPFIAIGLALLAAGTLARWFYRE